jgi:hypothetical protein
MLWPSFCILCLSNTWKLFLLPASTNVHQTASFTNKCYKKNGCWTANWVFSDWVGCVCLGCAGAVTAGTCVLCAAGTYQTGSGPPQQQISHGSEAMRIFHGVHAVVPPGYHPTLSIPINQHMLCVLQLQVYCTLQYPPHLFI